MRKVHKVLSLVILSAMLIAISEGGAIGCSINNKHENSTYYEKDSETGLPMLADRNKPMTFRIFVRDQGTASSKDNPVLKKIAELTGVTIKYEYLAGDLSQKEGVMLASEDYPDAVFADSQKFIDAGAFLPLEDKLSKYSNLNSLYSPYKQAMTAKDGHEYILEIYMSPKASPTFTNTGAGFYIQKAVLEEGGYKVPKTLDEYFNLIEDYKAKHPTINGVNTVGFEILCDGWRDFCLRNPVQHLLGDGNDGDATIDYKTNTAYFYQVSDTAKSYYKKLNEEYNKGIIKSETFTENYNQYISKISSGAVLGMFDQAWDFLSAQASLQNKNQWNHTYISVPITNPGVKDGYLDDQNATITGTNGIGITKKCKDPERLLEFYNWLLQKDVQDYLQWGVEGKDWTKYGTNDKVLTSTRRNINADQVKMQNLTGSSVWTYSPKYQGLYEDGSPCGPLNSVAEYKACQSDYDKKFLAALNISYPAQLLSEPVKRPKYYPIWSLPIEDGSEAKIANDNLNDVARKYYPCLIMAKSSDYDSLWDKFVRDFNASNPKPYLDEVNKLINEKNK